MKKFLYLFVALLAVACSVDRINEVAVGPQGPQGIPGVDGKDGVDGANGSIITFEYFETSQECPEGGVRFFSTVDGEIVDIVEVCDGVDGQDGEDGIDGNSIIVEYEETEVGVWVLFGYYINEEFIEVNRIFIRNGVDGSDGADGQDGNDGADGEDGYNVVMITGKHTEGPYAGETYVLLGLDTNRNGKLDVPDEVTNVLKIYDGQDGSDGEDGTDGQDGDSVTFEITETEEGCYIVTFFIDGEEDETLTLCNGKDGEPGQDGQDGQDGDGILCTPDGLWTGETGYVFNIESKLFVPNSRGGIYISTVSVNGQTPVNIYVDVAASQAYANVTNFVSDGVQFKNGKIWNYCQVYASPREYLDIAVGNKRKYYTR